MHSHIKRQSLDSKPLNFFHSLFFLHPHHSTFWLFKGWATIFGLLTLFSLQIQLDLLFLHLWLATHSLGCHGYKQELIRKYRRPQRWELISDLTHSNPWWCCQLSFSPARLKRSLEFISATLKQECASGSVSPHLDGHFTVTISQVPSNKSVQFICIRLKDFSFAQWNQTMIARKVSQSKFLTSKIG